VLSLTPVNPTVNTDSREVVQWSHSRYSSKRKDVIAEAADRGGERGSRLLVIFAIFTLKTTAADYIIPYPSVIWKFSSCSQLDCGGHQTHVSLFTLKAFSTSHLLTYVCLTDYILLHLLV
jgi:hypothetical protein